MSNVDYVVLIACYAWTSLYLYIQLKRAGAVKSRTGLVLAILAQVLILVFLLISSVIN